MWRGEASDVEGMRDTVSRYYDIVFGRSYDRHIRMQELLPPLLPGSKILDFGCGMGGVSRLLVETYDCRVDAVDISKEVLEKARTAFSQHKGIDFVQLEDFAFPRGEYDLVVSTQVIEHVHNVGNYLQSIGRMLKDRGYLLIGLPNIVNLRFLGQLMFFTDARARKHSKKILDSYDKAKHHINGWDPVHFITLCGSCGFELQKYRPAEGIPLPFYIRKIPIIGRYLPIYIRWKIPLFHRLSYTMLFLFEKVDDVEIRPND